MLHKGSTSALSGHETVILIASIPLQAKWYLKYPSGPIIILSDLFYCSQRHNCATIKNKLPCLIADYWLLTVFIFGY